MPVLIVSYYSLKVNRVGVGDASTESMENYYQQRKRPYNSIGSPIYPSMQRVFGSEFFFIYVNYSHCPEHFIHILFTFYSKQDKKQ